MEGFIVRRRSVQCCNLPPREVIAEESSTKPPLLLTRDRAAPEDSLSRVQASILCLFGDMTAGIPASQYTARREEGECPSPAIRASHAVVALHKERAVLESVRLANTNGKPDESEDEVESDDDGRSLEDERELLGCVRTSASGRGDSQRRGPIYDGTAPFREARAVNEELTRHEVGENGDGEEGLAANPDDGAKLDVRIVEPSREASVPYRKLAEDEVGRGLSVGGDEGRPGRRRPEGAQKREEAAVFWPS